MKKELQSAALGDVAGGKVVETKDGEFLVVPSFCKEFPTREETEKFEAEIREKLKRPVDKAVK